MKVDLPEEVSFIDDLRGGPHLFTTEENGLVGKSSRKMEPLTGFPIIVQFWFQLLADPAAVSFRRHVLRIVYGQQLFYGCSQAG